MGPCVLSQRSRHQPDYAAPAPALCISGMGPAALQWCSLWLPSFEASVSSGNWHKIIVSSLQQLGTVVIWTPFVSAVTCICFCLPFGDCSDDKNTLARKYIWLCVKELTVYLCIHLYLSKEKWAKVEHLNYTKQYSSGDPGSAETVCEFITDSAKLSQLKQVLLILPSLSRSRCINPVTFSGYFLHIYSLMVIVEKVRSCSNAHHKHFNAVHFGESQSGTFWDNNNLSSGSSAPELQRVCGSHCSAFTWMLWSVWAI